MRKQRGRKERVEPSLRKGQEIPKEIRQLVKGKIVHISEPGRFFPRKWRAMLPLVQDHVKQSGNTFELQPKLLRSFGESLRYFVALKQHLPQYGDYRPSDLVADALCSAAEDILGYPQGLHALPLHLHAPFEDVIQLPDKGADPPRTSGLSQDQEIRLRIEYPYREGSNVPELAISLAGKPISALFAFRNIEDDGPEKKAAQIEARRIWETVVKRLTVRLGVKRPNRGKPGKDLGFHAAWFHDHVGCSWAKIAKAECTKQHEHKESCGRNFRKLAQQFYLKQEKEYLKIASPLENTAHTPVT